MAQKAKAVANYFLERAEREGIRLTPLQLLKLVYIAHGWHLAVTGEPLINERVYAWRYGPVITDLYHEFKHFGGRPITKKATDVRTLGDALKFETPQLDESDDPQGVIPQVLDRVWNAYSRLPAATLVDLTHAPGTPWHNAYREGRNVVIPDDAIQRHFLEKGRKKHALKQ